MTPQPDPYSTPDLISKLTDEQRRDLLDMFGKLLMDARDRAILQWDQILEGSRPHASWEMLQRKYPDLNADAKAVIRCIVPNIMDTIVYCLLDQLESSRTVRISVQSGNSRVDDITKLSWGLVGEPSGERGWLVRFSKQRFDQPG